MWGEGVRGERWEVKRQGKRCGVSGEGLGVSGEV